MVHDNDGSKDGSYTKDKGDDRIVVCSGWYLPVFVKSTKAPHLTLQTQCADSSSIVSKEEWQFLFLLII